MVKVVVSRFKTKPGQEAQFEALMKDALKSSIGFEGMLGGLLLTKEDDPSSYVLMAFWRSKADREKLLKRGEFSRRLKPLLAASSYEWLNGLARLQGSTLRTK